MERTDSPIAIEAPELPKRSPRGRIDSTPLPTDSMITVDLNDSDKGEETESSSKRDTITSGSEKKQSRSRSSSVSSASVDWNQLDKSEEQQTRDEVTDEATALLLARLEQENDALTTNPKYTPTTPTAQTQTVSRPSSMSNIRRIVQGQDQSSVRFSMLPEPPPVTDLEFWVALAKDYASTVRRLPTFTAKKIREGIPPVLRGVIWSTMSGSRDATVEAEYERLSALSSPYEREIKKDIGRCFPSIPLFQDPDGQGQRDLAMVLKCFSLYDTDVGYCQGLAFLVGPLLTHMTDKDAFCVLVKLMEDYNIRSCFLHDLSGLLLRIYQFNHLLQQQMPKLAAHLTSLEVGDLYPTPWFLSFYANTCPFPMLERIYDVIFAEGASETVMRVALCLMKRNEKRLLECTEMDHAVKILLGRSIWDPYGYNVNSADDLVNDFVSFAGVVTRESLQELEAAYTAGIDPKSTDAQSGGAWKFIEKLWPRSSMSIKSVIMSPTLSAPARPIGTLRRTPSKQSLASTLSSGEGLSDVGSASTRATSITTPVIPHLTSFGPSTPLSPTKEDEDIIQELVMRVSDAEKQLVRMTAELQKEREEREEDVRIVKPILVKLKQNMGSRPSSEMPTALPFRSPVPGQRTRSVPDISADLPSTAASPAMMGPLLGDLLEMIDAAEARFPSNRHSRQSSFETKQSLRESRDRVKEQLEHASSRVKDLVTQLSEKDNSISSKEQELKNIQQEMMAYRNRIRDSSAREMRLEKTIQDLRQNARKQSYPFSDNSDVPSLQRSDTSDSLASTSTASGLREFRLGRQSSSQTTFQPNFSKRTSSLTVASMVSNDGGSNSISYDELLQQLAQTKTNEAVTKQELEELRGKYDSLRRSIGVSPPETPINTPSIGHRASPSESGISGFFTLTPSSANSNSAGGGGGGFWSWGKRSVSTSHVAPDNR